MSEDKEPWGRGRFYFSAEQSRHSNGCMTCVALLDGGRKAEYTEMLSPEFYEDSSLRPHAERFKDSVYLGEGRIYSINGVVQGKRG